MDSHWSNLFIFTNFLNFYRKELHWSKILIYLVNMCCCCIRVTKFSIWTYIYQYRFTILPVLITGTCTVFPGTEGALASVEGVAVAVLSTPATKQDEKAVIILISSCSWLLNFYISLYVLTNAFQCRCSFACCAPPTRNGRVINVCKSVRSGRIFAAA